MTTIKTGIIGTGFIGPAHVEAIRRLGSVEVAAVAERGDDLAQAKAKQLSIPKAYGDSKKLLADPEIQVVHNCTPNHLHFAINKEILAALPKGECDLATIYRSMHLLEKMGMVKRFDFGDGTARFELVGEGDDGHHHHLVCTNCSAVVEIEECFPGEIEKRIAAANGFKAVTHKLEFFGICPDCQ